MGYRHTDAQREKDYTILDIIRHSIRNCVSSANVKEQSFRIFDISSSEKKRKKNTSVLKILLKGFHLDGNLSGFQPVQSEVRTTLYCITNSTAGKYCSVLSFEWSHLKISCSDSKLRITLNSITSSTARTTPQYLFEWFHCAFRQKVLRRTDPKFKPMNNFLLDGQDLVK